jgi:hypothetical protein
MKVSQLQIAGNEAYQSDKPSIHSTIQSKTYSLYPSKTYSTIQSKHRSTNHTKSSLLGDMLSSLVKINIIVSLYILCIYNIQCYSQVSQDISTNRLALYELVSLCLIETVLFVLKDFSSFVLIDMVSFILVSLACSASTVSCNWDVYRGGYLRECQGGMSV